MTPAALFRDLGGWSGAGAISPMVFTSFMLKHVPDITQQQIGTLWWRADTNNDGQVLENCLEKLAARSTSKSLRTSSPPMWRPLAIDSATVSIHERESGALSARSQPFGGLQSLEKHRMYGNWPF